MTAFILLNRVLRFVEACNKYQNLFIFLYKITTEFQQMTIETIIYDLKVIKLAEPDDDRATH